MSSLTINGIQRSTRSDDKRVRPGGAALSFAVARNSGLHSRTIEAFGTSAISVRSGTRLRVHFVADRWRMMAILG